MKILKVFVCGIFCSLVFVGVAQAENKPLKGVKIGFGFDQGFSVVGAVGNIYGAIGDDGVAVDYIFIKERLNQSEVKNLHWFIGAGGFVEWDGDFGARVPIGIEMSFANNLDGYAEAIPRLRFNNNDKNDDVDFGLEAAIGVRYQF